MNPRVLRAVGLAFALPGLASAQVLPVPVAPFPVQLPGPIVPLPVPGSILPRPILPGPILPTPVIRPVLPGPLVVPAIVPVREPGPVVVVGVLRFAEPAAASTDSEVGLPRGNARSAAGRAAVRDVRQKLGMEERGEGRPEPRGISAMFDGTAWVAEVPAVRATGMQTLPERDLERELGLR